MSTFWWVDDWETVLGSVAALLAAIISVIFIRRQIMQANEATDRQLAQNAKHAREQQDQAERHHRENTRRLLRGEKAALPMKLSSVSGYLSECATRLRRFHQHLRRNPAEAGQIEFPKFDLEVVAALQRIIQFEDDDAVRDRVVRLLSDLQVLQANMTGLFKLHSNVRSHPTPHEVEVVCTRLVMCYAQVDLLYNYARGTNEFADSEPLAAWNAAGILGFRRDPHMHYLRDLLTRKYGPPHGVDEDDDRVGGLGNRDDEGGID